MNQDHQRGGKSQPPERAAGYTFTSAEYAALARLRWAIQAGLYDDDLAPSGRALGGQVGWALHAAARPGGSAGHPPRRKPHVDGELVIACLNAAGIIAAIAAAVLASGAV